MCLPGKHSAIIDGAEIKKKVIETNLINLPDDQFLVQNGSLYVPSTGLVKVKVTEEIMVGMFVQRQRRF